VFVGRNEYLDDLASLWRKTTSSLVACRGRRRIGKSTLIEHFADDTAEVFLSFEGLPPRKGMTNRDQLDTFGTALARQTNRPRIVLETWHDAFFWLDKAIDGAKRTVILLDEISWMGAYDPDFSGHLKWAWDKLFHKHDKLVMVICGSVSAWIRHNILDNTGFAGRFSRDYILPELPLSVCPAFWGPVAGKVSSREMFDVLSVTGGVPRYLEEIDPALSAEENIRRLFFTPQGKLFKEFDDMFSAVFGDVAVTKKSILMALAAGPKSGAELAAELGVANTGHFSEHLRSLADGGFIAADGGLNPDTGKSARIDRYRLRDNYTRFYLRCVEPRKKEIAVGGYRFASVEQLPGWDAILGLAFENLIVNNWPEILSRIGVGNAIVESAAPYRRTSSDSRKGVQIDLLVQTPRTVYVVEIKRKNVIGMDVAEEVEEKVRRLKLRRGMSVRPVLVYDGELDPRLAGCGYFAATLDAATLIASGPDFDHDSGVLYRNVEGCQKGLV